MYAEQYLPCPTCAAVTLVETPPCSDGHGADCPDRACSDCGTALLIDPVLIRELRRQVRRAA